MAINMSVAASRESVVTREWKWMTWKQKLISYVYCRAETFCEWERSEVVDEYSHDDEDWGRGTRWAFATRPSSNACPTCSGRSCRKTLSMTESIL